MECARTEEILSAYLDGDLPEGERKEVVFHLRQCPRCAEEERALRETVSLLRNLPVEKAPPGLLAGVRQRIGEEKEGEPLWKKLFFPAHVKIPLQAAAVVLVFLLVYGIQKQLPATKTAVSPPASVSSGKPGTGHPAMLADRRTPETPHTERTDAASRENESNTAPAKTFERWAEMAPVKPAEETAKTANDEPMGEKAAIAPGKPLEGMSETATADLMEKMVAMAPGQSEADAPFEKEQAIGPVSPTGEPSALAKTPPPAVPATRVSTGGQAIEPGIPRDTEPMEVPGPRVFAAPPSRLLKPLPYGREVTIEVALDVRNGLEDRIAVLAKRLGGKVLRERIRIAGRAGEETLHVMDILRVNVPVVSADAFLEELGKMGTIPPEGMPGKVDIPAGPTPDTVIYTVRILTR